MFLSGAVILLLLSLFSYLQLNKFSRSAEMVSHTNVVKLELEKALSGLRSLQNSQRGFLLTKDSGFLKSFYNARANYSIPFAKLSTLMGDNSTQKKSLIELKHLSDQSLQYIQQILDDSKYSSIPVKRILEGRGLMETVRAKADSIIKNEDALLKSRTDAFYENSFITPVVTFVIILAALGVLIFSYLKIIEELGVSQKLQAQLTRQNIELTTINKELKSFVYISSHDLQEPLRKIQTFADRLTELEKINLSEKGLSYLEKMSASALRMQRLIEDLLNYAQTTSRENVFEYADMNKLLEEVVKELDEEINQHHAKVTVAKLGKARLIPYQFRQLMHNLISNSLKFSRPGIPPKITINREDNEDVNLEPKRLSKRKEEIKFFHLKYTDNGIGFSQEYSEKIFEVFQRLHAKNAYAGTGIGLAICKKIVENHNGSINATGKENEGAVFEIQLPV
ncbi:MAG: CHASE3 domain-containing protein [Ferruginibacter sp.]